MLYTNISSKRLLICVKRTKVWVQPGESVNLTPFDVRQLGSNGVGMVPAKKLTLKKKSINKPQKKTVKKVLKDVAKSPIKKNKPTSAELKVLRAELKSAFENKNKGDLISFCEDELGMDAKWKDRKDEIIKKALTSAKKIGYSIVLKKI